MSREIFVDTGFWTALIYPQDQYHRLARNTWQHARGLRWPIVTANWAVYETLTLLSCSYGRHDMALRVLDFISQMSEILAIEGPLEYRSLEIFRRHADKRWSMVECAGFAGIEARQSEFALSYDQNFRQAQAEFSFQLFEP